MSFAPDWTLLVQDLLSPPGTRLSETTPALISYHLGTTNAADKHKLTTLIQAISTSPSLWHSQPVTSSRILGQNELPLELVQSIFNATRNGLLYRVGEISKEKGTGWGGQRELGKWLRVVLDGISQSGARVSQRVVIVGGLLNGLQQVKQRRDKLHVGGSSMTGLVENEMVKLFAPYLREADASPANVVPAWLASQTLPAISVDILAIDPVERLISLLTEAISSTFDHGNLFSSLPASLAPAGPSALPLRWEVPSTAHSTLSALAQAPAFTNLALTSRALARTIEAAAHLAITNPTSPTSPAALSAIDASLAALQQLCLRSRTGWAASPWSDLSADADVQSDPPEAAALPWTALKALLFSLVLVLSSVLVIASPGRGALPTRRQGGLAEEGLVVLGVTYFVAAKFGGEGFGAWRAVWKGLVEVVKVEEGGGAGERVLRRLEPGQVREVELGMVARSGVTFYLNLGEQLVPVLGDEYVTGHLLQVAHPYLTSATYRDTFESAHSVILALFACKKECALELVPWYTTLLLDLAGKDSDMSPSQLRLAFTTMIRAASATDDALAWHSILQLVQALKQLPASPPSPSSRPAARGPGSVEPLDPADEPTRFADGASTRLDEAAAPTGSEDVVLRLPRGKLLLTLVDQVSACSLFLLEGVLEQVWECVREEGEGEARKALGRVVFGVIGEGLGKEKRGEGVRFWMERGEELVAG